MHAHAHAHAHVRACECMRALMHTCTHTRMHLSDQVVVDIEEKTNPLNFLVKMGTS